MMTILPEGTRERADHARWSEEAADGTRVSAAEALRLAQAHVKGQERWKHPTYWAGWVLWGLL